MAGSFATEEDICGIYNRMNAFKERSAAFRGTALYLYVARYTAGDGIYRQHWQ